MATSQRLDEREEEIQALATRLEIEQSQAGKASEEVRCLKSEVDQAVDRAYRAEADKEEALRQVCVLELTRVCWPCVCLMPACLSACLSFCRAQA